MGWRSFFRNNTQLEKKLILFIVMLCFVVLILFITLFSSGQDAFICDSPQCVRGTTHILDTMDPSIDPCNDFYKFACGTFMKKAFSLGQPTMLHRLQDIMNNQLREIVIEKEDKLNISRMLLMQKRFYRRCMNETAIEEDNNETFLKLLDEVVGGWPAAKNYWVEKPDFSWESIAIQARKVGFFYEFYLKVGVKLGNDSSYMLWIKPPDENDAASFHWSIQNVELMTQIASYLGGHRVDKDREITRTLVFAENLNEIIQKHHMIKNRNGFTVKRQNFTKYINHNRISIDWFNFLQNITDPTLTENDMVLFEGDDYFTDLYYLLHKTNRKIQANYMAWAMISTNIQYMTKNIRDSWEKMQKQSNGIESNLSRSDICYKISKDLFKHIAEGEYVRRYTPLSKRKYIEAMLENIKTELRSVLENVPWMDKETKFYAVQRLQNITEAIGSTELVYDAKKYEKFMGYNQLNVTSTKLVDIARTVTIHKLNRFYSQLWQTVSDEESKFVNTPKLAANALYLTYFNKLILLTPLLQGFIFDERRPYYMNYGALGSIIGHEFIHGFVEFEQDTWWNTSISSFLNASRCIRDDYSEFSETNNITGQNENEVFQENVADFASVNLAHKAYTEWTHKNYLEPRLPGLQYTPNQLFWIMASTYLCEESKSFDEEYMTNLKHAVPSYRVLARLQNSPSFAKDFNCPKGSPMNPEKKCRIFT